MKSNEKLINTSSAPKSTDEGLALVRVSELHALRDEVSAIRRLLSQPSESIKPFLSEREAQEYLGCKTTWLWEQRRYGRIEARKVQGKVYYRRADLDALIEQGSRA